MVVAFLLVIGLDTVLVFFPFLGVGANPVLVLALLLVFVHAVILNLVLSTESFVPPCSCFVYSF